MHPFLQPNLIPPHHPMNKNVPAKLNAQLEVETKKQQKELESLANSSILIMYE